MRDTGLKAYAIAKQSGLITGRREQVFYDICTNGPCTQLESWRRISPNSNSGVVTTRFSELERMGLLKVIGKRIDEFTGMENSLYEITGHAPIPLEKKEEAKDEYTTGWNAALTQLVALAVEKQLTAKIGYATRIAICDLCTELKE